MKSRGVYYIWNDDTPWIDRRSRVRAGHSDTGLPLRSTRLVSASLRCAPSRLILIRDSRCAAHPTTAYVAKPRRLAARSASRYTCAVAIDKGRQTISPTRKSSSELFLFVSAIFLGLISRRIKRQFSPLRVSITVASYFELPIASLNFLILLIFYIVFFCKIVRSIKSSAYNIQT